MRVVAAVVSLVLATFYLPSAEGNISFSAAGATSDTYGAFIHALRAQLSQSMPDSDSQRFVLVDLTNYNGHTITVAIDAANVYHVVAYRAGDRWPRSYFLQEAPLPASDNLFSGTSRTLLPFSGSSYTELERAAGQSREYIPLGLTSLDRAITRLWNGESQAASLLVIIQMVSEASRFRFIEQRVRNSIREGSHLFPDPAMLSLENNWSALSLEIQRSLVNGLFSRALQLPSIFYNVGKVNNIVGSDILAKGDS